MAVGTEESSVRGVRFIATKDYKKRLPLPRRSVIATDIKALTEALSAESSLLKLIEKNKNANDNECDCGNPLNPN
jgi:hypothetical protein